MARCCGTGQQTAIEAGVKTQVTGTGTPANPYVISADVTLGVIDNTVFNLTIVGDGTDANPWVLAVDFASTAKLDHLPDVNAPSPTNNQVLGYDLATSKWTPRAPATAVPGAVLTDGSLSGDGSAGTPLQVREDPDRYLGTATAGLGLTDAGMNQIVRHFADDTARSLMTPSPVLNALSMIDTQPGLLWYWTGSTWLPYGNVVVQNYVGQFLAMSGTYTSGVATYVFRRQVSATTDPSGVFEVLSSLDMTGRAGVLTVNFQESGPVAYKAMVDADVDRIIATAYSLEDGTPMASQAVQGMVEAVLY